jgi:hypothetical protein
MAETLGSLCDKLSIIKLKQWHTVEPSRKESLEVQERQLIAEIDEFVQGAISGAVPLERLTFASNKVHSMQRPAVQVTTGGLGQVFAQLAATNCELWHEQEKVYGFELVPADEKNGVVKRLALLNLERTECIDRIDHLFHLALESNFGATNR